MWQQQQQCNAVQCSAVQSNGDGDGTSQAQRSKRERAASLTVSGATQRKAATGRLADRVGDTQQQQQQQHVHRDDKRNTLRCHEKWTERTKRASSGDWRWVCRGLRLLCVRGALLLHDDLPEHGSARSGQVQPVAPLSSSSSSSLPSASGSLVNLRTFRHTWSYSCAAVVVRGSSHSMIGMENNCKSNGARSSGVLAALLSVLPTPRIVELLAGLERAMGSLKNQSVLIHRSSFDSIRGGRGTASRCDSSVVRHRA